MCYEEQKGVINIGQLPETHNKIPFMKYKGTFQYIPRNMKCIQMVWLNMHEKVSVNQTKPVVKWFLIKQLLCKNKKKVRIMKHVEIKYLNSTSTFTLV